MKEQLQAFVNSLPMGFLKAVQLPELIALDRLAPCLVRCGGCRFVCPAQDVDRLMQYVTVGGDYVRDVSISRDIIEKSRGPLQTPGPVQMEIAAKIVAALESIRSDQTSRSIDRQGSELEVTEARRFYDGEIMKACGELDELIESYYSTPDFTPSELLTQLQTLVNLHDGLADGGDGITDEDWAAARAAIEKACNPQH